MNCVTYSPFDIGLTVFYVFGGGLLAVFAALVVIYVAASVLSAMIDRLD